MLEERLVQHDESRGEVQRELDEIHARAMSEADSLEERISGEIQKDFDSKEERILGLIEKLNERGGEGGDDPRALIKEVNDELSKEWKYEIQQAKEPKGFADSYELNISFCEAEERAGFDSESSVENMVSLLQERLDNFRSLWLLHEKGLLRYAAREKRTRTS